jgi:microsomal epoxide hydrolase
MTCPDESKHGVLPIEDHEKAGLERGDSFGKFGAAYAQEHMTRPSTIGFVLSSSPLALLGWYVTL